MNHGQGMSEAQKEPEVHKLLDDLQVQQEKLWSLLDTMIERLHFVLDQEKSPNKPEEAPNFEQGIRSPLGNKLKCLTLEIKEKQKLVEAIKGRLEI